MNVLTEIWVNDDIGNASLWAHNAVPNAQVIPEPGDNVVFRSASVGSSEPTTLSVAEVAVLATLDGYRVRLWYPGLLGDRAAAIRLREELVALDWDFVAVLPPLPALVDADDFDDD